MNAWKSVLLASSTLCVALSVSAADLQVIAGAGIAAPLKEIVAQFEKTTGHKLVIRYGTTPELIKMATGGPFDLAVVPVDVMRNDAARARFAAGATPEVARVGIGVAVRAGAPKPDISTPEALKRTLLNAKSIAHPDPKGGGFTGAHIDRMFERLGIADTVRPKVRLGFAFAGGVDSVAKGEVELGLFNISEIVPAKGVTLVGPLPDEHQNYLVFAGALHARGASPGPAAAYLRALIEPGADAAWIAGGMEALGDPVLTGTVPNRAGNRDRPAQ